MVSLAAELAAGRAAGKVARLVSPPASMTWTGLDPHRSIAPAICVLCSETLIKDVKKCNNENRVAIPKRPYTTVSVLAPPV